MTTFEGPSDIPRELPSRPEPAFAANETAFQFDPSASDITPLTASSTPLPEHGTYPTEAMSPEYSEIHGADADNSGEAQSDEPFRSAASDIGETADQPSRAGGNSEPPGPPKPPISETGPGPEENPENNQPFGVERFEGQLPANDVEKLYTADLLSTAVVGLPGLHADFIDVEVIGHTGGAQTATVVTRLQRDLPEGSVHIASGPDGVRTDFTDQSGQTSYNRYYRSLENTGTAIVECVRKDTRDPNVALAGLPEPGEVSDYQLWQMRAARRAEVVGDTRMAHELGVDDPIVSYDELRYALGLAVGAHPETKTYTDVTDIVRNSTRTTELPSDLEMHAAARETELLAEQLIASHPGNYAGRTEITFATPSNLLIAEVSQVDDDGLPSNTTITLRRYGKATPDEWFKELTNMNLVAGDYPAGTLDQAIYIQRTPDGGIHGAIETTLSVERVSEEEGCRDVYGDRIDEGSRSGPQFSQAFAPGPILIRTIRNLLLSSKPNDTTASST